MTEEPEEKYSAHAAAQQLLMNQAAAMANIPVTTARGVPPGFPLMQYCQMIQQMQNQHLEFPMAMIRKEKEEGQSTATTPSSSRRQTISTPSGPRPIRVPAQSLFNPLQFGLVPQSQPGVPPNEESLKSPPPSTNRPQSPPHTYNTPCFQRADEEIYTKYVESVRKLAAKLTAEKS